MIWTVRFSARAERQLEDLDPPVRRRIVTSLHRLSTDPHTSPNVKLLAGTEGNYRLRVGDWRVIYTIESELVLVLVLRIAHRREAYR